MEDVKDLYISSIEFMMVVVLCAPTNEHILRLLTFIHHRALQSQRTTTTKRPCVYSIEDSYKKRREGGKNEHARLCTSNLHGLSHSHSQLSHLR